MVTLLLYDGSAVVCSFPPAILVWTSGQLQHGAPTHHLIDVTKAPQYD